MERDFLDVSSPMSMVVADAGWISGHAHGYPSLGRLADM